MKKSIYIYPIAFILLLLHYYFIIHPYWTDEWKVWVSIYVFSAAAVILDFWAIPIPLRGNRNRILLSMDSSVYLASVFVLGIFPALCTLLIATIVNLFLRRVDIWKVLTNFNIYFFMLVSSHYAFVFFGGDIGEPRFSQPMPYIIAIFVYLATNAFLVGLYVKILIGEPFSSSIPKMVRYFYIRYVVSIMSSITLSSLLYYHGMLGVFLFVTFIVLIAVSFNNYYVLYQEQKNKAITDPLTGLYNHGYFHERLEEEVQRAKETGNPLSLLLLDLDDFKKYNDLFGHTKGDQYLKRFADLLRAHVRPTDMVFRYGGEEFAIILPQTDVETAYNIAQAMRKAINDTPFPGVEALPLGCISFSGGISTVTAETLNRYDLIKKADIALYYSKKQGKNQVHIYRDCLTRVFMTPDDAVKTLIENLISVFRVKDRTPTSTAAAYTSTPCSLARIWDWMSESNGFSHTAR
ncbi:GGDEF domain-containing protein [Calditerricola satsumensis]|uniref:GGDEF domain-containing protein n=1 Tax=Calditerricola satsumensis TaxID=373054 RepID=UPI0009FB9138|nr:GGDEF domain-containing protein [Calditerricola satsumensis]